MKGREKKQIGKANSIVVRESKLKREKIKKGEN